MDPLFEKTGTPYQYTYQNPIRFTDPTGMEGESVDDWIKNKYGKYLWLSSATSSETTPGGWEYVGKDLPSGIDAKGQDILEMIDGKLYYKNTSNTFREAGNWINEKLGGDSDYWGPEKKPYDQADENMIKGIIENSLIGYGVGKGLVKATPQPKPSIADQALKISKSQKKNTITTPSEDPNVKYHYDLQGAEHQGVPTPHVQRSIKNTNPKTGEVFWNKDRKWIRPMNQKDIDYLNKYLKIK